MRVKGKYVAMSDVLKSHALILAKLNYISNLLNSLDSKVNQVLGLVPTVAEDLKEKIFLLPDHLRNTLYALKSLGGEATAAQVSKVTEKARAVESAYLNQLARLGFIRKKRKGRIVYFQLIQPSKIKKKRKIKIGC
jgi:DNA-binding transcriptional ArsR family regulator